ncbi:MAG: putative motility protein [Planctomycetota bacterium]
MSSFSAADATALTQSTIAADIGVAVARKSLDNAKQQGAAAISLLEGAAQIANQPIQPGKGEAIDVTG